MSAQIFSELNQFLAARQDQMEQALLQLLAIESTQKESSFSSPFGVDIDNALTETANIAQSLDLVGRNKGGYYTTVDLGNITAGEALGVISHVDVVPLGEGWHYQPLGEIVDNKIYGRGTMDDKGPTIAILFAMNALKALNIPLTRGVRLVVGGNEENGSACLAKYNATDLPLWGGFSPDGHFPVIFAEKGIVHYESTANFAVSPKELVAEIKAGTAANAVPGIARAVLTNCQLEQVEKVVNQVLADLPHKTQQVSLEPLADGNLRLTVTGKAAHASTPHHGENALALFCQILLALPLGNPSLQGWLSAVSRLLAQDYLGLATGIACQDQVSGELTSNLGILNYQNHQAQLKLDIRYPVTADFAPIHSKLTQVCQKEGINLVLEEEAKPLYIPEDNSLVQTLLGLYQQEVDANAKPLAIGGGTYCRDIANFVAFGPLDTSHPDTMHQADEFIYRKHLLFLGQIYAKAIYLLAK